MSRATENLERDIADSVPFGLTYVSTDDIQAVLSELRHSVEREAGLERAVEIAIASMERDECAPCHRIALNTCSNALSPTPPSTGSEK